MTYILPGLTIIVVLLVCAFCLRDHRWKNRLLATAGIALFLWSWLPFAWLTSGTLEWWYPLPQSLPDGPADAIVVLGGGADLANPSQPETFPGEDTYARVRHGARLYKTWRPLPIVVAGGPVRDRFGQFVPLANVMARALAAEGVPEGSILEESRSSSTYENAAFSANILRARGFSRIVLITEGYHMLRAEKTFRKQGLTVYPAPCSYQTQALTRDWPNWFPHPRGILWNEHVLHEWIGLTWYRLSGKL